MNKLHLIGGIALLGSLIFYISNENYGYENIGENVQNSEISRGIRNNNPGNIRKGLSLWRGRVSGTDTDFVTFSDARWGIRALGIVLLNYQRIHRLSTVEKIISRYAPSTENNTRAYINAVAGKLGVRPDQKINVRQVLPTLIAAIIHHENRGYAYPHSVVNESIGLI